MKHALPLLVAALPSAALGHGAADSMHHDQHAVTDVKPSAGASMNWWAKPGSEDAVLVQARMLNEALLAGHSATMVLDAWCAHHGMAAPNGVSIQKISSGTVEKIPAHVRKALAIPRGADIMHRRVRLLCGGHILSEADNWYVPARIPPVMRETLTTTDVSFGRVLAPLNFTRKPLTLKMLATAKLISKAASQGHGFDLFAHNALLSLPDGQPLAYVQETYKSGALEFVDGADTLSH